MPTRYAAMLNLPQADIEGILRRRLEGLGVVVRWNRKITNPSELDASFVVGCDGAHSAMRKSISVDLAGATFDERFLLADVRLGGDVDDSTTNTWVSTSGVLGILPLPNGLFRLNGTLIDDEAFNAETLPETLSRRMGVARRRVHVDEVLWAAEYHTHSRLATSYRRDNVFLAGDAAHLNSPVGGQGMNVGIGDALDLGARLGEVQQGQPQDILDGYETRRRPVAERVITTTEQGTAMLTARRPVERFVRNQLMRLAHRLPPFQRRLSTEAAFISQNGIPEP